MSKFSLIIYGLITVLLVLSLSRCGVEREWVKCKESLIRQYLSGECTPLEGIGHPQNRQNAPESDTESNTESDI